ncbi:MAG TPA: MBL fold metallo-hydrolase [Actinomycetota bacterium]|nr:MBL fold metallo-hydrolase [Actinomycetota bacterium]
MLERFVWFKQSAFLWRGDGLNVYIDPWGVTVADPADVIFITHAHFDHFSKEDIERVRKEGTKIVAPRDVAQELSGDVTAVRPGDSVEVAGVKATAVPAYNVVEGRLDFHPKRNEWVGYVLTLGGHTYYHAGDTDHAPELDEVRADVVFLPIGGTYTMEVGEAAGLARRISPQLAVPMHYGFVEGVGRASDGDRFAREAAPVRVELLKPENPFEYE